MRRGPLVGEAARPVVSLPRLGYVATIAFLSAALWAGLLWAGAFLVHLNRTGTG